MRLGLTVCGLGFGALLLSGAGGWDRSTASVQLALLAAVVAIIWIASRQRVPDGFPEMLAAGIALLAIWAAWQVAVGFDRAGASVAALPPAWQANAADRLTGGRAFASLLLPGHLAALFAMALPVLVGSIQGSRRWWLWSIAALLTIGGLVMTRSPIGIGLAACAMVVLLVRRRSGAVLMVVVALLGLLSVTVLWRADVAALEPVQLRLDNWRTAVWVWGTAPVAGVGFGGYGQATQAVPFEVGNRPAHAHNLPLEMAAELGVTGVLGAVVAALWLAGLARRLWPDHPAVAVGLVVVPIHNLVDFSLHTSGVAVPWALYVGWCLSLDPRTEGQPAGRISRAFLVTLAAGAVAVGLLHATSVALERAAIASDSARQRFSDAELSCRFGPWRVSPVAPAVSAALETGHPDDLERAAALLERGRFLRPRSAALAEASGRVDLARGAVPTGAAWIRRAAQLQPALDMRIEDWNGLRSRLDNGSGHAVR
jgi:hypothetical protein